MLLKTEECGIKYKTGFRTLRWEKSHKLVLFSTNKMADTKTSNMTWKIY